MLVLGDVEAGDAAVMAARGDDRDLALEADEGLDDRRLAADRAPRRGGIVARAQRRLALAVIAEPPRLEDRRHPDGRERRGELAFRGDPRIGRGRDVEARR